MVPSEAFAYLPETVSLLLCSSSLLLRSMKDFCLDSLADKWVRVGSRAATLCRLVFSPCITPTPPTAPMLAPFAGV